MLAGGDIQILDIYIRHWYVYWLEPLFEHDQMTQSLPRAKRFVSSFPKFDALRPLHRVLALYSAGTHCLESPRMACLRNGQCGAPNGPLRPRSWIILLKDCCLSLGVCNSYYSLRFMASMCVNTTRISLFYIRDDYEHQCKAVVERSDFGEFGNFRHLSAMSDSVWRRYVNKSMFYVVTNE